MLSYMHLFNIVAVFHKWSWDFYQSEVPTTELAEAPLVESGSEQLDNANTPAPVASALNNITDVPIDANV